MLTQHRQQHPWLCLFPSSMAAHRPPVCTNTWRNAFPQDSLSQGLPRGCWPSRATSQHIPGGVHFPCVSTLPAAISSSHSPTSHSFQGTALAQGCVTLPRPSTGAAVALHYVQHPPKWLQWGAKPPCLQSWCLMPSIGTQQCEPCRFSHSHADFILRHLIRAFCFPGVPS